MENRIIEIKSKANKKIKIGIIPGHFATNHSHVNYFIDMTTVKHHHIAAKETARELAKAYMLNCSIDTIICFEGTEIIGAFLASELAKPDHSSMNSGKDISVITPEINFNGQILFRDNIQREIFNKHVLLLISSASTGKTIKRSVEILKYYNGKLAGISSIFSAIDKFGDIPVNTIFTSDDINGYKTMPLSDCELCQAGQKVDAIVNSFGYSKL